jgi:hypothetical protein
MKEPNMTATSQLENALTAAHSEAHSLIEALTTRVDGIDPTTANWGHVGDLNYIIERLRELVPAGQ